MDRQNLESMYKISVEDLIEDRNKLIQKSRDLEKEVKINQLQYRIQSVYRVLEHINDKCWKKEEIKELHTLIVHCLNKLSGNLDGVELKLEEEKQNARPESIRNC